MKSVIEISQLNYAYGANPILRDISLSIGEGEFFFLLGPSGCGKTTLLRSIAGLGPRPQSGSITLFGKKVDNLAPWQRETPLVFQNYALWPHMSVFDNVAFGLKMRNDPDLTAKVDEVLETVQLSSHARKRPNELSGGQQQRVALARAMVLSPRILLLDEPLSNLDARLRQEMRYELKRIHNKTGITFIYVTHDQEEALSLATGIALLNHGQIVQTGTPRELYHQPRTLFCATFMGAANVLPGTISRVETEGSITVTTPMGIIEGVTLQSGEPRAEMAVTVVMRPEALSISPHGSLRGEVMNRYFLGPVAETTVGTGGHILKTLGSSDLDELPRGETVTISVAQKAALAFSENSP
ncbi:ABC transporter ATP-binding protein [Myxococcota bacterium]|nr:ABC transporter ATP-binding protein [Myxococcota bacterium]MBU1536591.1 ABC transporter ATP-binding protein [Myxococcota bacterium]